MLTVDKMITTGKNTDLTIAQKMVAGKVMSKEMTRKNISVKTGEA